MVQIDRSIYSHGTTRRSQRSGAAKRRKARAASGAPLTPHSWGEALFMSEVPLKPTLWGWLRPQIRTKSSSSSLLLSILMLCDTNVYEPYIQARLGTASRFCEVVVLTLRAVPTGTALIPGRFCSPITPTGVPCS